MSSKVPQIVPSVKAEEPEEEEEIVCPQETLRNTCKEDHHVAEFIERYNACNDRVNAKSQTAETCEEELFDYIHALDHCVNKTLFSKLK